MMLEKLSLGTFVKNLRNKMLPNNLIRNSVAKNRTKMLSRKLPLETFVKRFRERNCEKRAEKTCH